MESQQQETEAPNEPPDRNPVKPNTQKSHLKKEGADTLNVLCFHSIAKGRFYALS